MIRNDTGRRLGPGLDIRGDGGYVIAPPSRHTTGASYRWHSTDRQLPNPPDWLLDRIRESLHTPRPSMPRTHVALSRDKEGVTWEQVGEAFGTTRQSAHERFRTGTSL